MKKIIFIIILISILAIPFGLLIARADEASTAPPAPAEEEGAVVFPGGYFIPELYWIDSRGTNQSFVREYDGRGGNNNTLKPDIKDFFYRDRTKDGDSSWELGLSYPIMGDEHVHFYYDAGSNVTLKASIEGLTHRIGRYQYGVIVGGQYMQQPYGQGGAKSSTIDLTNGADFFINRQYLDFSLDFRIPKWHPVRWLLKFSDEMKNGQVERRYSVGPTQDLQYIARETKTFDAGFESKLGKKNALAGHYYVVQFNDTAPLIYSAGFADQTPWQQPNFVTRAGGVKLRGDLTENISYNLGYGSKNRKNLSTLNTIDISNFNAGISWRPDNNWIVNAKFQKNDTNRSKLLQTRFAPAIDALPLNNLYITVGELGVTYLGRNNLVLEGGYKYEQFSRPNANNHMETFTAPAAGLFNGPNDSNYKATLSLGLKAVPVKNVNIEVLYKNISSDKPDFRRGVAGQGNNFSAALEYLPSDMFMAFANYNNNDQKSNDGTFTDRLTTYDLGFIAKINSKWGITGRYGLEDGLYTSDFYWFYSGALPHGAPKPNEYGTPFEYKNNILSGEIYYNIKEGTKLRGVYTETKSTATNRITTGSERFPVGTGVVTELVPLNIRIRRGTIGIDYKVKTNYSLFLDFGMESWADTFNTINNGSATIIQGGINTRW
ncbi:MAG: hypothetical protein M1536_08005 [Firmicutes bacterium]|nr:hypothetical protein [Bacillota bacterium]